jgi:hypothetical protein
MAVQVPPPFVLAYKLLPLVSATLTNILCVGFPADELEGSNMTKFTFVGVKEETLDHDTP